MRIMLYFLLACSLQFLAIDSQLVKKLTSGFNRKDNLQVGYRTVEDLARPPSEPTASNADSSSPAAIKAYSNYDFIPGDTILFEDNFADDQDGEFPAHWQLRAGQGVINKIDGAPALILTEGNFVRVSPRMRAEKNYVPNNFTIEFDFFANAGYFPPMVMFQSAEGEDKNIEFGKELKTYYFINDFSGTYPGDLDNFADNWHHAAMVKKGSQIKCYMDQYRVLVIPDCGVFQPVTLQIGGRRRR